MNEPIVERLRIRAEIRRNAVGCKSVQEGKPDRLADLLDEAADVIEKLACNTKQPSPQLTEYDLMWFDELANQGSDPIPDYEGDRDHRLGRYK